MYQEFFTRTIESKFIKNVLYNTPLPTYKVVRDGDYVFGGNTYIYKEDIIRVNYVFNEETSTVVFDGSGFLGFIPPSAENNVPEADKVLATYTIVGNYNFGQLYPQFTERFISEFGYYDSGTHEALGKYLRCVRNLYNVDLMPFYNCFSGRYASNLSIAKSRQLTYYTIYKWFKYHMPLTKGDKVTETFGGSGKEVVIKYGSSAKCDKTDDNKYSVFIKTLIPKPKKLSGNYVQFVIETASKNKKKNAITESGVFLCDGTTDIVENTDGSYTLLNGYKVVCPEALPSNHDIITATSDKAYPHDEWLDDYWYMHAVVHQWNAYPTSAQATGARPKDKVTFIISTLDFKILYSRETDLTSDLKIRLKNPTEVPPESLDGWFIQFKELSPSVKYTDVFKGTANTSISGQQIQQKYAMTLKKVYPVSVIKDKTPIIKESMDQNAYPDKEYKDGYWYEYIGKSEFSTKISKAVPIYTFANTTNNEYKLLQIPIELNQDYTIALESDCEIYLAPAIIKNNRRVVVLSETKSKIDLTERLYSNIEMRGKTTYKHPFSYRLNLTKSNSFYPYITANERHLYLLIQIPATEQTTVTVLEGSYLKPDECDRLFNWEGFEDLPQEQKDKVVLSKLSMLMINDKKSYAFPHRLIEYLTKNVITPLEEIDYNITRVQQAQGIYGFNKITKGIWDEMIRLYYYDFMKSNTHIEHYDLNGYIDKNTEKWYV